MKNPMTNPLQSDFLGMFREFASLDKRRATAGVTPLEFQRWSDLKMRLGERFEQRGVAKSGKSPPTRLRIELLMSEIRMPNTAIPNNDNMNE